MQVFVLPTLGCAAPSASPKGNSDCSQQGPGQVRGLSAPEDVWAGAFLGTPGAAPRKREQHVLLQGDCHISHLRLGMCADEEIQPAKLGIPQLPRFCCLFHLCSRLKASARIGKEQLGGLGGKWDLRPLVGLGLILFCMWGWKNQLGYGWDFTSGLC